jgi:hypothetical protein
MSETKKIEIIQPKQEITPPELPEPIDVPIRDMDMGGLSDKEFKIFGWIFGISLFIGFIVFFIIQFMIAYYK